MCCALRRAGVVRLNVWSELRLCGSANERQRLSNERHWEGSENAKGTCAASGFSICIGSSSSQNFRRFQLCTGGVVADGWPPHTESRPLPASSSTVAMVMLRRIELWPSELLLCAKAVEGQGRAVEGSERSKKGSDRPRKGSEKAKERQ